MTYKDIPMQDVADAQVSVEVMCRRRCQGYSPIGGEENKMKKWLIFGIAALQFAGTAIAQDYPTHEVKIIVPYAPGGGTDAITRVLATRLSKQLGKSVIIDNRGGAGSTIGMATAAASAPDGYTVVVNGDTVAILDYILANVKFDVRKDFAPVAFYASAPIVLAAHPSFPANNIKELIELAKKKPGEVSYATPGVGTPQDLAGKLFAHKAGIKFTEVPYRGAGPALADVLAGHAQIGAFTVTSVLQYIPTGKLKVLAVVGDHRTSLVPELPSTGELGLPGVDISTRYLMFAPAGTPPAIVNRLHGAIAAVLKDPETIDAFRKQGFEPFLKSPAETAAIIRADHERWGPILKAANVVPQ
jgi:tripartite-type tricarboxylate transporter receptor subunit TctC